MKKTADTSVKASEVLRLGAFAPENSRRRLWRQNGDFMIIKDGIKYVGVTDREIDLFEGQYRTADGMTYNSYVISDEKTAVMDTVDERFFDEWLDRVKKALDGREPDYLVVHHMEPDHSANIARFLSVYPKAQVVATAKAFSMMKGFFGDDYASRRIVVKEGDTLSLGSRTLTFVTAPMVHWPEVMLSYDKKDGVLFSADAFGKFGASLDEDEPWAHEARRYYIGIVGKYGAQVQALLKKVVFLNINAICPLHGPVLTKNIPTYISLYDTWSSYRPEDEGAVIAYTSVYGNTKKAALMLKDSLLEKGAPRVEIFDLARCDMSEAVAAAFRYSTLVLATTTYNGDIFPFMREFISHLTERGFKNRTVALIENGSWAPMAAKVMHGMLEEAKGITFAKCEVKIQSALDSESSAALAALSDELCKNYDTVAVKNDPAAMFKIGYGLYVVTTKDESGDNGLIVNTVSQLASSPLRVSVAVSKSNYSHYLIKKTGVMNVNCLTTDAPFSVFEQFGFKSGRSTDKFKDCTPTRSENGLIVLPRYINAYMSLRVEDYVDLGSHGMFICSVTEARTVSDAETMTYTYYQKNVKPRPAPKKTEKTQWVCTVCGYVEDAEELPDGFECPICKHGKEVFVKAE